MTNEQKEPYWMDDRPSWDLIKKRNEEFLKELEANYGPRPLPASEDVKPNSNGRAAPLKKAKSA